MTTPVRLNPPTMMRRVSMIVTANVFLLIFSVLTWVEQWTPWEVFLALCVVTMVFCLLALVCAGFIKSMIS